MAEVAVLNRSSMQDEDVAYAAEACDIQLREHFCPKWDGVLYTPVRFYQTERDLPIVSDLARLMVVSDTIDVDNGAVAYHTMDPFVRGVCLSGPGLASRMSHECTEMSADPGANQWVRMPDGRNVALEVADPVQDDKYTIAVTILGRSRAVEVSDFVLPNWFDKSAGPGVRDHMGTLTTSFNLRPGGYIIVQNLDGSRDFQWGATTPVRAMASRVRKVLNSTSRSYKRGVRLADSELV